MASDGAPPGRAGETPVTAAGSPYVIAYRGRFAFDVAPRELWASIERGERFESWWSWLGDFRLEGERLEVGAVLHGVVSPPVPYRMRVRVDVERCVPCRSVDAAVHGDIEGDAHMVMEPAGSGTAVEVGWTIEMMQRAMRVAARVAHPLLRWGHDRVVEATVDGYRRAVARRALRPGPPGPPG